MLDENKIAMMTRIAQIEEGGDTLDLKICSYYRLDYITIHILISLIWTTIAYVIVAAGWCMYDFSNLVLLLKDMDMIMDYIYGLLWLLGGVWIAMAVISGVVYNYKYSKAKERYKQYLKDVSQLNKYYKRGGLNG